MALSKAVKMQKPALRVDWITPQSDVTITHYQVQYKRKGADSWITVSLVPSGSATSTVLDALNAGTAYRVRIRAVSAIGNGEWNSVEPETTYICELRI